MSLPDTGTSWPLHHPSGETGFQVIFLFSPPPLSPAARSCLIYLFRICQIPSRGSPFFIIIFNHSWGGTISWTLYILNVFEPSGRSEPSGSSGPPRLHDTDLSSQLDLLTFLHLFLDRLDQLYHLHP